MTIDERISYELKQNQPEVDDGGVWQRIETAAVIARRRRSALLGAALVAAIAAVVVGWLSILSLERPRPLVAPEPFQWPEPSELSEPAQWDVPTEHLLTIRQLVDAINTRNTAGFIDAFEPDGSFNPHGDFRESSSLFGRQQPVSQVSLVEAWMAIIDAWRFEAELLDCNLLTDAGQLVGPTGNWVGPSGPGNFLIRCDVATRWQALSMEITEAWVYGFRETRLLHWDFDLLDLDPDERTLPLGYDELQAWEMWLRESDPKAAARYLNPRQHPLDTPCDGCEGFVARLAPDNPELADRLAVLLWSAENDWKIEGHPFRPLGLVPYDPALADEIEASIHDYLKTK